MRSAFARFTVLWAAALSLCLACSGTEAPGVVVESLSPQGAAGRAGLRPGDVLLSWRRPAAPPANPRAAAGDFRSCTDFAGVESEQAPRGRVELRVRRGARVASVELPAGDWQVEVLPRTSAGEGCRAWARARRLTRESRWSEAREAWAEALREGRGPLAAARILREQGVCLTAMEDFTAAEGALHESLRRLRQTVPDSLDEAAAWHALGRLEQRRGDFRRSAEDLRRALALRSRLAPESLERVSTLNNLGIDAWYQGDLATARALYLQALGLVRRRAPAGLDEARVLNNLGLLAREKGDVEAAASYLGQAGGIWQRLDPGGQDLARNHVNLGALATDRGDFALADQYYREALRRFEARAPESLEVANILHNLGIVARERFDLSAADLLLRHALAIRRRLAPGSLDEAASLSSLATVSQDLGRLGDAEGFARRALALRSRHQPGSLDVAVSLAILAAIASRQGDLRQAASLSGQALAIHRRLAPGGTIHEIRLLIFLGSLDLRRQRWREAEARARQALAMCARLAPHSYLEAEALNLAGRALWRAGRQAEAAAFLTAALDSLEAQIGRLGGTEEARSSFQTLFSPLYENLIAFEIARGDAAAALQTLERWRARILLMQIAQRDLAFSADVPAPLLARQRALEREYEQAQGDLAAGGARASQGVLVRLTRLRNERSELVDRIVRASPRYASLRYPRPLDLAAARRALDPGTVWLSYFVGADETYLFAVTPEASGREDGLALLRLPIGRGALAAEAAVFRGLILRGKDHPEVEAALLIQGRKLYDLLIAPAAPWIARADRILISPDGPLHTLPFAALVRPGARPEFLLEWRPVHTTLSATLYAELKRHRRRGPAGGSTLIAFADPRLPAASLPAAGEDDPPLRRYRAGLPPLPGAREEVRALAALFGRDALIYTGAAATKTRAEHLPRQPRYVHFACHALLDRGSPLDSALALAPDAGGDGLLAGWEILERLRLDADLVTLSACGTGLGREAAGEGLIGLTRAFQHAGARSILASLWGVSDRSTAALMARFYAGLRAGLPKDRALQEAQRQLLRGGELSHPYSWAGFELSGDWR